MYAFYEAESTRARARDLAIGIRSDDFRLGSGNTVKHLDSLTVVALLVPPLSSAYARLRILKSTRETMHRFSRANCLAYLMSNKRKEMYYLLIAVLLKLTSMLLVAVHRAYTVIKDLSRPHFFTFSIEGSISDDKY